MSEKGNQAVKTVSFMMLITLFGKILGMVREQLLAAKLRNGYAGGRHFCWQAGFPVPFLM